MQHTDDFFFNNEQVQAILRKYQQPTLFYKGSEKWLCTALDGEKKVVLKFVADMDEARHELSALEDLHGRYHIVKMHDFYELDDFTVFVLEHITQKPEPFQPRTSKELADFAYQLVEVTMPDAILITSIVGTSCVTCKWNSSCRH